MASIKLFFAPVAAAFVFAWELPAQMQGVLNLASIATIIAGVFTVSRYRSALDAADKAGDALERERDAEFDRAERLQTDVVTLQAKVVHLEGLPDLRGQEETLKGVQEILSQMADRLTQHDLEMQAAALGSAEVFSEMTRALREIHTAVVPPDIIHD